MDAQVVVDLLESLHKRYQQQEKKMNEKMPKGLGKKGKKGGKKK